MIRSNFLSEQNCRSHQTRSVSLVDSPTRIVLAVTSYRGLYTIAAEFLEIRIVSRFATIVIQIHVDRVGIPTLDSSDTKRLAGRPNGIPHSMPCPYQLELEASRVGLQHRYERARRLERSRSDRCLPSVTKHSFRRILFTVVSTILIYFNMTDRVFSHVKAILMQVGFG